MVGYPEAALGILAGQAINPLFLTLTSGVETHQGRDAAEKPDYNSDQAANRRAKQAGRSVEKKVSTNTPANSRTIFASSPILWNETVIVQCDVQTNSFIAAFDLKDGRQIWQTPRKEVPTWSTPTLLDLQGKTLVILNGYKHIGAYHAKTGQPVWHMSGGGDIPVPTPIIDNDFIYITNAHGRMAPIYAIRRARKFLDEQESDVSLCVTGGFRDSGDIAKALALGADAVAMATASMIAIGCQQYRICHTGRCPVGVTSQDPALRARLDPDRSSRRLANFLRVSTEELQAFARLTGNNDVHQLAIGDLCTTNSEISAHTEIGHV